jgi:hypothetical protein
VRTPPDKIKGRKECDDVMTNGNGNHTAKVLIGVGAGAAIGLALALRNHRRDRWSTATQVTRRVAAASQDMANVTQDIIGRVRLIYSESNKLVKQIARAWEDGRKLAGA